jgi:beta-glucosidase
MIFLLLFSLFNAQDYPFQDPTLDLDTRLDNLISLLTSDEKIGQMIFTASEIQRLGIPYYVWWNEALHGVARSGPATSFPQAIGLGATFDDDALFEAFTIVSDEARAKVFYYFLNYLFLFIKYHDAIRNNHRDIFYGITFWTPNINIVRDSRWGRGQVGIIDACVCLFYYRKLMARIHI